ncbi:phosphogluconate dehydrogenase (NAD(+)-dependent, decarboxylating) [Propionicimonas sp.]|uniref:phosphogluconate dehydrogenase (NAD(+)-dependent, decarboxylating) n=1 Tax=Propionicimonas sp. TaxID=1955623 RepID=UPI0039E6F044
MQLGMVGLGRMGGNMAARLRSAGHTVIGYDTNPALSDVPDLAGLVARLGDGPRVVWVMVPVQFLDGVLDDLAGRLGEGDIVIDGGNTKWTGDQARADRLGRRGVHFIDCGVSGGVWGKEYGYALMCGGDAADVAVVQPIFDALKPEGEVGFVHAGGHGAGHFAKMVHNGIEYSMMQAYAEGWELLEKAEVVHDVPAIFDSWREGTVIRSWLLDLIARALSDDPHLEKIRGYADDSGEGRWTVDAAIDLGVPVPALTAALFARFVSRQDESPAMKLVAAMRNQFGGHAVQAESPSLGEV